MKEKSKTDWNILEHQIKMLIQTTTCQDCCLQELGNTCWACDIISKSITNATNTCIT